MIRPMRVLLLLQFLVIILLAGLVTGATCDGGTAEAPVPAFPGRARGEPAMPVESGFETVPAQSPDFIPSPKAAPAPPAPAPPAFKGPHASDDLEIVRTSLALEQAAAQVSQQRIIVRTVDMRLEVADVPAALDSFAQMAQQMGGWVISTDRSQKHRGSISVRVPADRLDEATLLLRSLATEVKSEVTTSQDVTDEYVDTTARLRNQQATQDALLKLLEKAENVEDALKVQTELTRVQEELERLQGRIKFLEQTSAFSLINVFLELSPADMTVDAGPDQTFSVGQPARFRAFFKPPQGIKDFTFTWDFGDGSEPVVGYQTAPTLEEGTRVTATIHHVYYDDRESPFIAEVTVTGTGEAGVVEGKDLLIATVTKLPTIEVFAGDSRVVEEDEKVEFAGTFTRPKGLIDLSYRWEFGDGTAPATGSLAEGVTQAVTTHVYADHRPFAYTATLTISAQSEAGEVETSGSVDIFVTEARRWVIGGWSAGDTGKTAVRALSGVGQGLATIGIWLGILSPLWVAIGIIVFVIVRRRASSRSGPPSR